jgi:hypothetical protein
MHRLENRKYCKCKECVAHKCGKWWEHHNEQQIVPNEVRRFDGARSVIESLWSRVYKGARVAIGEALDIIAEAIHID